MLIKYIGKRRTIAQDIRHVRYVFKKENDYTCEVPDADCPMLIVTGLFLPVQVVPEVMENLKSEEARKKGEGAKKEKPSKPEKSKPEKSEETVDEDLNCPKCGKLCKNSAGLAAHERHCKGEPPEAKDK